VAAGARPRNLYLAGGSIASDAAAEPTTASPTTLSSAPALAPVSVADGVTLAARWGSQGNGDGEF